MPLYCITQPNRITRRRRGCLKHRIVSLASVTVLLILGGCAFAPEEVGDNSTYTPIEKPFDLQHRTDFLMLHFSRTDLDPRDHSALKNLLHPGGVGKSSVHVSLPKQVPGTLKNQIKKLKVFLQDEGVTPEQLHSRKDLKGLGRSVQVRFDTYQAKPKACFDQKGMPMDHFGCATASNLLLMIDDPIILFKGTPADLIDASRDAAVISAYRKGQASSSTTTKTDTSGIKSAVAGLTKQ